MIIRFSNSYLESIAKDESIKGKPKYDKSVIIKFKKTLKILQRMPDTKSLRLLNSLNFEPLKGKLKGKYSVRVDYHYRLIFLIEQDEITVTEILLIEDLSNHYQ
ncbi:type II toxin-antitoxin system RelE/ParE family toxin [Mucilaginibacter arboris]|uniref:Toxin n=1 Tax=Mucilaginibacter arboris TaxID=2682090 RepID=A0A7K1SU80_9SPHI|nr:type II toxin-antitoxin system RelE/ParE family toxin [Mucilaginibacter arboris]MVN20813.1 toxin [Mucilaginibacter arboris]